MKKLIPFKLPVLITALMTAAQMASAQLTLAGNSYLQNFNDLGNGLPTGWTLRLNATATNLGTVAVLADPAPHTWGATTAEFRNCASTVSNAGTNFIGTESTAIQSACTNRALAIRQGASFGDPGAAFVLQIADTVGRSNLTLSLDLQLLKSNGYATTWSIQYAVGNAPESFIALGTFPDPAAFGSTASIFHLGADADNRGSNLWIRIAALAPATGSGSRDTFAIDNFSLHWDGNGSVATTLALTRIVVTNGFVVIDFDAGADDAAEAFQLQTADDIAGPYSDGVMGAEISRLEAGHFRASHSLDRPQQFYRIKRP
ncbi:MAG TPA: hypothetical protein VFV81_08545 [Verrucomicrobiae bacterium]|nr:hypothetical protein [Verrucomicrobiae bacterium]